MKTKIILSLIPLLCLGCVSKKYFYLQNKTGHDIEIFQTDIYDVGQDTVAKIVLQKQKGYADALHNGLLRLQYHKILKNDSLIFIGLIYGEKSKTELTDPKFVSNLMGAVTVLNGSDTLRFNAEELAVKANEAWANKNARHKKLKFSEKTRLVWEFKD